jgi:splicing factor 3B subunit 3
MHLYHLTVLPPATATYVAYGSFSGARQQEVVLASGSSLHLYRLTKAGALVSVARGDAFAALRAIAPFRLTGSRSDLLLVTSDAGSLALLSFSAATRSFTRVRVENFGRTGCRRVVPGHFLAADPKGRACMVAAVERSKFAYVLARDATELVSVQSPLEAHKTGVVTHALVALDVAFENPMFAALEVPYSSPEPQKLLVYYELDLGLNHVTRRYASPVRDQSYVLLAVPGGADGPGGVLVCSPGRVTYRNLVDEEDAAEEAAAVIREDGAPTPGPTIIETLMPHRVGATLDSRVSSVMVVCGTMHRHKDVFFFILCTEHGDLIKAELDWSASAGAIELRLVYFDSLPAPAHALAIFRSGYLFASLETGDPLFLKFNATSVANDDTAGGVSSSVVVTPAANGDNLNSVKTVSDEKSDAGKVADTSVVVASKFQDETSVRLAFNPRSKMTYFTVVDVLESLAPSVAIASGDFCGEGSSQLVCAGGRGKQASLRVLRRGFAILELMAQTMPGSIIGCFTMRERAQDTFERFIVVSFADATKVLRVTDDAVAEVYDTGFVGNASTIVAAQVGKTSLLQIYRGGVRFVPNGKADAATEWKPPGGAVITSATANSMQVVVALTSGDVVYFEVGTESETLDQLETLSGAVAAFNPGELDSPGFTAFLPSLAIPEVPSDRKKAKFVAISDGQTSMVRLYQLDADGELKSVGVHMAPAPVDSLALVDFGDLDGDARAATDLGKGHREGTATAGAGVMFSLVVGTRKGAAVVLRVDAATGAMSSKRTYFLGPRAVHVQRLRIAGVPSCFAMSARPWLLHRQGARIALSPLCTDTMGAVAAFSSDQYPDGFVAVSGSTMRFLSLESLNALSSSAALPARLSPSLVPADTALGSTFFMSKSRLLGTPRRLAPVFAAPRQSSRNSALCVAESREGAAGPNDGLFVVIESEHRAALKPLVPGLNLDQRDTSMMVKERKSFRHGEMALSEADIGVWASQVRLVSIKAVDEGTESVAEEQESEDDGNGNENHIEEGKDDELFDEGYASAATTLDVVTLTEDAACALCVATSTCLGVASDQGPRVVVSVAKRLIVSATSMSATADRRSTYGGVDDDSGPSGELHVFKVNLVTRKLELSHVTDVAQPIYAMVAFRDMILVGVGTSLRLYDLGKRQLLRKAESRMAVRNQICAIAVAGGDRIFVGDVQGSVTLFKYFPPCIGRPGCPPSGDGATGYQTIGRFSALASDVTPRCIVSLLALDYSSVCGSDKFGNLFVLRLPSDVTGAGEEDAVGANNASAGGRAGAAELNLVTEACVHVGSTVTGLTRGTLRGGTGFEPAAGESKDGEVIIYSTVGGAVGVLAPFSSKSDADLAVGLERQMRERDSSLVGRSHMSYRSSFCPVKNVVDGDLCELFVGLSRDDQVTLAEILERDLSDVLRKLDEFRSNVL